MKGSDRTRLVLAAAAAGLCAVCGRWVAADSAVERPDETTYEALFDVTFVDPDNGWAVGRNGVVLRSEDGGRNWSKQRRRASLAQEEILRSVGFCHAHLGFAVGSPGLVLRTTDGGATWERVIRFRVQRTVPGNCRPPTDPAPEEGADAADLGEQACEDVVEAIAISTRVTERMEFDSIHCQSADNLWVIGDGALARSWDRGRSFHFVEVKGVEERLNAVFFLDESHGWAVGAYGLVLSTTDGGERWSATHVDDARQLMAVSFFDEKHGIVVGETGACHVTKDGGLTFSSEAVGATSDLIDVVMIDRERTVAVGEDGIFTRIDGYWKETGRSGGKRNRILARPGLHPIALTRSPDGGLLLVGTHGLVARSIDGGETWENLRWSAIGGLREREAGLAMRESSLGLSPWFGYVQPLGSIYGRYTAGLSLNFAAEAVVLRWLNFGLGFGVGFLGSDEEFIVPPDDGEDEERVLDMQGSRFNFPLFLRAIVFDKAGWSGRLGLSGAFVFMNMNVTGEDNGSLAKDLGIERQRLGVAVGQELVLSRRFAWWNQARRKFERLGIDLRVGLEEAWSWPTDDVQADLEAPDRTRFGTELWLSVGLGATVYL